MHTVRTSFVAHWSLQRSRQAAAANLPSAHRNRSIRGRRIVRSLQAAPTATVAPAGPAHDDRPLSAAEGRRLRMIATSVGQRHRPLRRDRPCLSDAHPEACVDRAGPFSSSTWTGPRTTSAASMRARAAASHWRYAVKGVSSFNLAARQLDYGDPAEVGTAIGRRDCLALVDVLRPAPSELRVAAASGCR